MKTRICLVALCLAGGLCSAAQAGWYGPRFYFGVYAPPYYPGVPLYVPPPVYAPVYGAPAPVYQAPMPVYLAPPYSPAPAVAPAPVMTPAPVTPVSPAPAVAPPPPAYYRPF